MPRRMQPIQPTVPWALDESNTRDKALLDNEEEEERDSEVSLQSILVNTDTEQSDFEDTNEDDENGNCQQSTNSTVYISKNGTAWQSTERKQKGRIGRENITSQLPGVKRVAKNAKSELECWQLYFTDEILEKLVEYTNIHLDKRRAAFQRSRDVRPTSLIEMKAVLGLLYMIGVKKANHLNLEELWAADSTAPDFFRASMSLNRFYQLLTSLRFDDIQTREERSCLDRLAAVRELFEYINDKCKACYTPGQYVVVDEMLESFRGHCKFRVYIPSKPAKYGVKVYALVDARSFYTINMEIYAGEQPRGPFFISNTAYSVVKRITEPVLNSGRNVTMDNFFTSVPLALDLLKNHRTTIVGTLRKNKVEIPTEFKAVDKREVNSSLFGFTDQCAMVSYVPKRKKNVLLLSTFHHTATIDEETGNRKKPEIVTFYNMTKGGVDVVDEMKSTYAVNRETRRWPMVIFYGLTNIVGINAQIIYRENTGNKLSRRIFLSNLGKSLVMPYLRMRVNELSLSTELGLTIKKIGNITTETSETGEDKAEGFCYFCPRRQNKKTKKRCKSCSAFLCGKHVVTICERCEKPNEPDSNENTSFV